MGPPPPPAALTKPMEDPLVTIISSFADGVTLCPRGGSVKVSMECSYRGSPRGTSQLAGSLKITEADAENWVVRDGSTKFLVAKKELSTALLIMRPTPQFEYDMRVEISYECTIGAGPGKKNYVLSHEDLGVPSKRMVTEMRDFRDKTKNNPPLVFEFADSVAARYAELVEATGKFSKVLRLLDDDAGDDSDGGNNSGPSSRGPSSPSHGPSSPSRGGSGPSSPSHGP